MFGFKGKVYIDVKAVSSIWHIFKAPFVRIQQLPWSVDWDHAEKSVQNRKLLKIPMVGPRMLRVEVRDGALFA